MEIVDARLAEKSAEETLRLAVSDALFTEISSASGTRRADLVGLRRAIHNGKVPSRRERSEQLIDSVSDELRHQLRTLAGAGAGRAHDDDDLRESLARSLAWLDSAVQLPFLRRGLAQASPVLLKQLERKPSTQWGRRQRVSAVRYVTRAATKTSPYSTFTLTGLATPDVSTAPFQPPRVSSVLELDQYVVEQIVRGIGGQQEFYADRLIRVTPSVEKVGGQLIFLGPPPKESLVKMRDSAQLRRVLEATEAGPQSVDELLSKLVGNGSVDERPSAVAFVERLVDLGLLETRLPLDEQDTHLIDKLSTLVGARLPGSEQARALRELARAIQVEAALGDVESHIQRIDNIHGGVSEVARGLQLPWSSEEALRKIAFHENAILRDDVVLPPALQDPDILSALNDITSWLAVHDRMLPVRIAAYEYVHARFPGRTALPLFELYRAIQADLSADPDSVGPNVRRYLTFLRLSNPVAADALAESGDDRLRQLNVLRMRSRTLFSDASERGEGVSHPLLRKLWKDYPSWISPLSSATFYLQTTGGDPLSKVVLNVVGAGNGRGRSRWWRLKNLAEGLPDVPLAPSPLAPRRVVELSGVFGAAGNLRSATDGLILDYPHTGSWRRERGSTITLPALHVRVDEESQLLELQSADGEPLLPVHVGLMADPLLPPAARFLMAAFGESNALHPAFPLINKLPAVVPPVAGMALRRVSYGPVVIERAKWVFAAGDVPITRSNIDSVEGLTVIEQWRLRAGVPEHVFVRLAGEGSDWREQAFGKARKPMFVDLRSLPLLESFSDQLTTHGGLVVLEEALPGLAAGVTGAAQTEFITEIRNGEQCLN